MRLEREFHAGLAEVQRLLNEGHEKRANVAFGVFWHATRRVWRGMATRLYQRWTPPTGCNPDDVEQELLMAAWRYLREGKYDATRGRTLADYIIYNACNQAKYWLHQQRGAILHGNRDKHPTRAPTSFDPAPPRDAVYSAAYAALTRMRTPETQEHQAVRKQQLTRLVNQHTSVREQFALASLYYHDGNVPQAAHYLYDQPLIRQLCRLGDPQHALCLVRRTAHQYLNPKPQAETAPDEFAWVAPAEPGDFDWK